MRDALTMKLEQFTRFDVSERQRLDDLANHPRWSFARGETIIPGGRKVENIHLVLNGPAARSKTLAFLVPGDLCAWRSLCFKPWTTISSPYRTRRVRSFPQRTPTAAFREKLLFRKRPFTAIQSRTAIREKRNS